MQQRWFGATSIRWKFDTNIKRACRAIGINAVNHFQTPTRDRKDPKRRIMGFHIDSLKPIKISEWQRVFFVSISSVENFSCGKSLRTMKSGYSMTIWTQKVMVSTNQQHQSQNSNASKRRFCFAFSRISRAWFIMSCWNSKTE